MLVNEHLIGQSVKGYDLLERIGAGAFGAVYRAYQSTIGREVAVKVILPGFSNQPDFIRRFEMEAQLVARLEHIHIVPLYDYWRDVDGAYLVMRWLRGGSLKQAIQDAPLSLHSAVRLIDQVSSGLAAAHRKEIIHRDLKPSNILLDEDGNAYLADFSIALDLGQPAGSTKDGEATVGSPGYLSPEQVRRELVSPQSDIYSLGVVLYELLSGRHPFLDDSPIEIMYRHLNDPLPPIEGLEPELQQEVNAVIQKATAKNPRQRYKDVLEMATSFRKAANVAESSEDSSSLVEILTRREQEILALIVDGRSNKQIAQELVVELSTVKWYITQIYSKMNVRSRMQAIVRARELQLVLPEAGSGNGAEEGSRTQTRGAQIANPYKGLRAFEAADSRDFFGREALTEKLVARLGEDKHLSRFLAILGPSGCGKSSLVKAGLIPAIRRGALPGSERWFIVEMTPGERPLDELELALVRVAADQGDNIRALLERDAEGLWRAASLILPQDGSQLLIVIDQLEEAFTLAQEEERRHFLELITAAAAAPKSRVRVVITLRADYYDRPLQYPEFGELIRRRMETVLPLSAEELERAILRPADRTEVRFEAGLAATIIEDIHYQPGALPLLQYALTELFDHRQDKTLTQQAYQQVGGAVGALAKRAEQIYGQQSPEGKEAVRQLFLRLVSLDDGDMAGGMAPETQRRAQRQDILAISDDPDLMDELIDTLAAYRLLSLDHDPATRKPTVQLAHEAILREWERLRAWLDQSREDLLQQRRLSVLCQEWLAANQDDGYLLREARLDQFSAWASSTDLKLAPDEAAFLQTSLAAKRARQADEEARRQRELETARKLAETERQRADEQSEAALGLRRRAFILGAALVAAIGLAVAAYLFFRQAEAQRRMAYTRELAAAAINNLDRDPELSLLLALQSAQQTYPREHTVLPEAEDALHRSLQAHRLLLTLPHGGALALSPDGTRIATGGEQGQVKLWQADNGEPISSFAAHASRISDLAFSPDGQRLLSGGMDGSLKLWEAASGQQLLSLTPGEGPIYSVTYHPDGIYISAGMKDSIVTWDANSGDEIDRYLDAYICGAIRDLVYTQDGDQIGASLDGGCTIVLDSLSGQIILEDREPLARGVDIIGVAFSPSGRRLAVALAPGDAKVRNLINDTGKVYLYGHTGGVTDIEFTPDGRLLATASQDGTARVWDSNIGRQMVVLAGHRLRVNRLTFFPDGQRLATTSDDGTTRVWDISVNGSREWLTVGDPYRKMEYVTISPDGRYIAMHVFYKVNIRDAKTGAPVSTLELGDGLWVKADFSPQPGWMASTYDHQNAGLHEISSGKALVEFRGHKTKLYSVVFNPGGEQLATGDAEGVIKIWEIASGRELASLAAHRDRIIDLEFHPDGNKLASSSEDGQLILWDLVSGQPALTLLENQPPVASLSYSPDGKRLVTSGSDGSARIWDTSTGQLLLTLEGHSGAITGVEYSPDGQRIATSSVDGTARLWGAASGQALLTLRGHSSGVTSVAFYPDGKRLATSSFDGTVRVYALDIDDLLSLARQRLTRSLTSEECQPYLHLQECPPGQTTGGGLP